MEKQESRLTIPAVLNELAAACEFVAERARAAGLDDNAVYHCHLSVEEVCTNVIEHGYEFQGDDKVIDIVCNNHPGEFVISIIDDAPAFDPLSLPPPDPSAPVWEREGGGWGVYFVKQFMDDVSYKFLSGRNHFMMIKRY